MTQGGKPFGVNTEPSKEVVVDSLTRDATVEACIFDLIDNSIDAARDTASQRLQSEPHEGLPDSYEGFTVDLAFSGDGIRITDNCGGIPVDRLKDMVLRFGRRSDHDMGIGVFGVGLNRALFKLGKVSHLKTDTGSQRSELILKTEEYLRSSGWELPAEEFQTSGTVGTEIEIKGATQEIAQQFADTGWVNGLRHAIGQRYARFIDKRMAISINGVSAEAELISVREDGPYESEYKIYKSETGVSIHIKYGQHSEHRFSKEEGYDQKRNSELTDQFGWTVLCNDRAILIADRSDKTGWDTKFHTEFYGFVGVVSFISSNPAALPWNTTKTDVDMNNSAYRLALTDMRKFAEKWRAFADQRKKPGGLPKPIPPKANPEAAQPSTAALGGQPKPTPTNRSPGVASNQPSLAHGASKKISLPVKKPDYHQFRTVLPDDVDEKNCLDKHLAMVHEAKKLDVAEFTFAGLALIRMLFEVTVITYLHRHNEYTKLRDYAINHRRGKGVTIKPETEKNVVPRWTRYFLTFNKNQVSGERRRHI